MCGITGFVNNKKDKKKNLKLMTERIKHRGPDAEGVYIDDDVALGHRRLSIIDLSTGNQPIFNEDKSLVIIFNGEVYNYQVIKDDLLSKGHIFTTSTDTEVILHAYEEYGKDCVKKFRGMFAFIIWDINNKELFIARDQFGIKQLYYYLNNGTLMFGSEIKAFLDHPDFIKEFNESILSAYLCFNSVPTEESFFKGVKRLEPGHYLTYKDGELKIERYFKLEFNEGSEGENIVEEIHDVMIDSVKHHAISDVPVGSFLSGGIDSSYLVSILKPDKTYTVGYENPKYDETSDAKELAKELGIDNKSKIISKEEYLSVVPSIMYHMDEPLADPSAVAVYFVSQLASEDVKVVTSGEGSDEFFGGYHTYKEDLEQSWYMKIPFFIRRGLSAVAGLFPDMRGFNFIYRRGLKLEDHNIGLGRVFRDKEAMNLVKVSNQIHTKEITKPFYEEYKDESNTVKRQVIDIYFWLIRDFLHSVDRTSMMYGLEARTPFLDLEVFKVANKLSIKNKINSETTKVALREAAKNSIPNESYKRKKLGFPVPLRDWMKTDEFYNEILNKFNSDIANKYFDNKKIIKLLNDQRSGKKDNYKKVWTIYIFIVWYNEFFGEAC